VRNAAAMSEPTPATDRDISLGEQFPRTAEQMEQLRAAGVAAARPMIDFIHRSPTPYHVVSAVAAQLEQDGFEPLSERAAWRLRPGDRRYVIREGSTVIAFVVGARSPAISGFRMVGAHTDSPAPRLKPRAAHCAHGYQQLGVETYGGGIWASWLDRDLSIAGRLLCRSATPVAGGLEPVLVDLRQPVARIANVAIHLNRTVNDEGLKLNPQKHLLPILGLGDELELRQVLADAAERPPDSIASFDLLLYDTQKGSLGGLHDEFVFSPRLDNLASAYAAVEALRGVPGDIDSTALVVLYDHEECGSRSAVGAAGPALRDALERIATSHPEEQVQALSRALAMSYLVSADMAHAVHPNYADLHDEDHQPRINRGLVIKTNANQSYATTGPSAAFFAELCHQVGYEPQSFVSRTDLRCGSSIGPIASTELGVRTVDVGAPMLSMHSAREMTGTLDVHLAIGTFEKLFR
jgi:aspartyl aminopeptidase